MNSVKKLEIKNDEILDDSEYESKYKEIEHGIIQTKLQIMIHIMYKNIKWNFIYFIEKMRLKINLIQIFAQDDNFLYIFPKEEITNYKLHFFFRKFSYVTKKYIYRQNFILKNYFQFWKLQSELLTNIGASKEEFKKEKNLINLVSKIDRTYTKRKNIQSLYLLSFLIWYLKSQENKKRKIQLYRACLIISSIFNRRLLYFFKKFPINNSYRKVLSESLEKELDKEDIIGQIVESENSKKEIVSEALNIFFEEKRKFIEVNKNSKLIKAILKQNMKYFTDKNLSRAFRAFAKLTNKEIRKEKENKKLENNIQTLKIDSIVVGSFILNLVIYKQYSVGLIITKKLFFEKLFHAYYIKNTMLDYLQKYKKIPQLVNERNKTDFLIVRNHYHKIFALKKLFLMSLCKRLNVDKNKSLILKKFLIGSFYKWKSLLVYESTDMNYIKKIYINQFLVLINQKFNLNYKLIFFRKLYSRIILKKNRKEILPKFTSFLFDKLYKIMLNRKFDAWNSIFTSHKRQKISEEDLNISCNLMLMIYEDKIYRLKNNYFQLWKNIIKINQENNESITSKENMLNNYKYLSCLLPLYKIIVLNEKKKLRYYFNLYRKKIQSTQKKKVNLNQMIIQNLSYILFNLEDENKKVLQELYTQKHLINIKMILRKYIISKHKKTLLHYYTKWYINSFEKDKEEILLNSEKISKEINELINTYYSEKDSYKKLISEYLYMKKSLCQNCIGNDFDIDYKSLDQQEIEAAEYTLEEDPLADFADEHADSTIELKDPCNNELNDIKARVEEKELSIKNLEKQYKDQLEAYENVIKNLNEDIERLTKLKNEILNGRNEYK